MVIGLLFSVDVYTLVPSTVVRKKKKTLLEQSQVQEEEMLLCEVSDLRSLVKTDSYHITDLKEAQLSNPQKYKFDFPLGGGRRRLRGFG